MTPKKHIATLQNTLNPHPLLSFEVREVTPQYSLFDFTGTVLWSGAALGYVGVTSGLAFAALGGISLIASSTSNNPFLEIAGSTLLTLGGLGLATMSAVEYAASNVLYNAYMEYQYPTKYAYIQHVIPDYPADYTSAEYILSENTEI